MSLNTSKLNDLSREELYSVITQLKRQINCFEIDLITLNLYVNCLEKYFDYFNAINQKITDNKEILQLINKIKSLKNINENNCLVSVKSSAKNIPKRSKALNEFNIAANNVWTQLHKTSVESTEDVDNNQMEVFLTNDTSLESPTNEIIESGVQLSDIFEEYLNTNNDNNIELNVKNKFQSEDNDNDFDVNDLQMIDISDQEFNRMQKKFESSIGGPYVCTYDSCGKYFHTKQGLIIHKTMSHKRKRDGSDDSEDDWVESEMRNISKGKTRTTPSYMCDHIGCGKKFTNKKHFRRDLMRHKTNVHNISTENLFNCSHNNCDKYFTTHMGLRTHEAMAHQINTQLSKISSDDVFRCHFKGCSAVFVNSYRLNRHSETVHRKEGMSEQLFSDDSDQERNQSQPNTSSSKSGFFCSYGDCGKSFNSSHGLITHEGMAHHKERDDNNEESSAILSAIKLYESEPKTKSSPNIVLSGTFICTIDGCNRSFCTQHGLITHKAMLHSTGSKKATPNVVNDQQRSDDESDEESDSESEIESIPENKLYHSLNNPQTFMCDHIGCGKEFSKKNNLLDHQKIHSGSGYKCEWEGCGKQFSQRKTLYRHVNQHKGKYRCDWSGCQYNAETAYKLKLHQTKHSSDKQFKCRFNGCNQRFKKKTNQIMHQLRAHPYKFGDLPFFVCKESDCSYKSKCRHTFKQHVKSVHSGWNYTCDWPGCDKAYKEKQKLKQHMNVHTGQKTYQCDWPECGESFKDKQQLDYHVNVHTGQNTVTNPYQCGWPGCDETFDSKSSLSSHQSSHN